MKSSECSPLRLESTGRFRAGFLLIVLGGGASSYCSIYDESLLLPDSGGVVGNGGASAPWTIAGRSNTDTGTTGGAEGAVSGGSAGVGGAADAAMGGSAGVGGAGDAASTGGSAGVSGAADAAMGGSAGMASDGRAMGGSGGVGGGADAAADSSAGVGGTAGSATDGSAGMGGTAGTATGGSAGMASGGTAGMSTGGSAGTAPCGTNQKRCDGVCLERTPQNGCNATACTACPGPAPANGVLTCNPMGECAFDCLPGYRISGNACVPSVDAGADGGMGDGGVRCGITNCVTCPPPHITCCERTSGLSCLCAPPEYASTLCR